MRRSALLLACLLALGPWPSPVAGATDPTLVFWLKLDDGSGSWPVDSAGGDDISLVWSGGDGPEWVAGRRNGAMRFEGLSSSESQFITVVWNSSRLGFTTGLTATAWVRLDERLNTRQTIVGRGGLATDWYYAVTDNGNRLEFGIVTAGGSRVVTAILGGSQVETGTWYHIAATYDGSYQRLYLNGVQVGSRATTGAIVANASALNPLGVAANARNLVQYQYPLYGILDEVKLWNRALTAAEVLADMSDGATFARLQWRENF